MQSNSAAELRTVQVHPPAAMVQCHQWLPVLLVPKANGKVDKLPCDWRSGAPCNAHDPAFWTTHDQARTSAAQWGSTYTVGFVITAADSWVCLDLDNALQADGNWSKLAQELYAALPGAVFEVSQSGRGLHAWCRYPNPPPHRSKRVDLGAELYSHSRFIVLGEYLIGTLAERCDALPALIERYFKPHATTAQDVPADGPCAEWAGPVDDEELLRRAMRSKSADALFGGGRATFADLWTANEAALARTYPADTSSTEPFDRSSADAALASHLAFWTGKNQSRMTALMRRSGLVREKYERPDYLPRTVANACAAQREVLQDKPSATAAPAGTTSGLTLLRADRVPLTPIDWLWAGFLPVGMLTILGGAPGCGKTTIALALGATVSTAGAWPDGTRCTLPGDVLVWTGEDLPSILSGRLVAMGANLSRVHFVGDVGEGAARRAFDPGRDMPMLEAAARQLPAPRLLIVDPIVSAVAGDSHKNAEVRRALQPVVDLAQRLGCAVLGITHFTKGTAGRDPTERITGSLAFGALARVVLAAAKVKGQDSEEPRRVLVRAKSNIGPDDGGFAYDLERVTVSPGNEGQRVNWLEPLHESAREVLAEADTGEAPRATADPDLARFVEQRLTAGPIESAAWKLDAEASGFNWRKVQDEAKRRGARPGKFGMAKGWFWRISDKQTWARTRANSPPPTDSATSN